jgi:hypothetical protein
MGLLDDAIRDHLELKRRRGADPGEIAHEERAALDPVLAAEQPLATETVAPGEDLLSAPEPDTWEEPLAAEDEGAASEHAVEPIAGEAVPVSEETAELDMQAVLDADGREPRDLSVDSASHSGAPGDSMRAGDPLQADTSEEGDSFEWEMPGEGSERPAEPGPDQERMSFE